ncbi:DUF488 family protein [Propionibacteriaceae bacterium Y2011]
MHELSSLVSIGYEGRDADDLVQRLVSENVTVLVDVRLTPISRKPGLSKTRLAEKLEAAGIRYVHHRELGNPKDNRDGYRAGSLASRERFARVLQDQQAEEALAHVRELLEGGSVALLCFERDHSHCHRRMVADAIRRQVPDVRLVTV